MMEGHEWPELTREMLLQDLSRIVQCTIDLLNSIQNVAAAALTSPFPPRLYQLARRHVSGSARLIISPRRPGRRACRGRPVARGARALQVAAAGFERTARSSAQCIGRDPLVSAARLCSLGECGTLGRRATSSVFRVAASRIACQRDVARGTIGIAAVPTPLHRRGERG